MTKGVKCHLYKDFENANREPKIYRINVLAEAN